MKLNPGFSRIVNIATANPSLRMNQADTLKEVLKVANISPRARNLYERFFGDHGIGHRHFAFIDVDTVFKETYDQAVERFEKASTEIGSKAGRDALEKSLLMPGHVDALIVTTCTGYVCPGLATHVAQQMGLREDIFLLDLVGQGCGAAGPALRAADHFLKANPNSVALVICVEICSAAFSDGESVDLLISNAIFADGAAAAVVSNRPETGGLQMHEFQSLLLPEYRDELRFKTKNSRLCNVISKRVPSLAASAVRRIGMKMDVLYGEPDYYAFHPGGRVILDAIQEEMGLNDRQMQPSRDILKNFGNMSSPSILFVLENILSSSDIKNGQTIFAFTFGAGFSAYSLSLIYRKTGARDVGNDYGQQQTEQVAIDFRG